MRFEVIIPSTRVQGEEASVIVHARNWKAALRQGLTRQGEDPSHVRGAVCDIRSDDVVHITDAVSLRTFRLIVLDRDSSHEQEALPDSKPAAAATSLRDQARHTRLLHHVPTTDLPAVAPPPEPSTTTRPALAETPEQPASKATETTPASLQLDDSRMEDPGEHLQGSPNAQPGHDPTSQRPPEQSAPHSDHHTSDAHNTSTPEHNPAPQEERSAPPEPERSTTHLPKEASPPIAESPNAEALAQDTERPAETSPSSPAAPTEEASDDEQPADSDPGDMGFVDLMAEPEEHASPEKDAAASIAEAVAAAQRSTPRTTPDEPSKLSPEEGTTPALKPSPMKNAAGLTREDLRRRGSPTTLMPQVNLSQSDSTSSDSKGKLKRSRRSPSSSIRYKSGTPRAYVSTAARMRVVNQRDGQRVSQDVERHRRVSSATIRVIRPEDLKVVAENALEDIFLEIHDLFELKMSIEDATDFVLDMAIEKIPCESASVLFATPDGAELYFAGARGPEAAAVMDARLKIHEGIAGFCTQNGVSLMIDDVRDEPRFHAAITDDLGLKVTSLICAPIQIKGRIYGCIQLLNHKQGPIFKGAQLDALGYIGFQLARLIQERLIEG